MSTRRSTSFLATVLVASFLVASPALAAPAPETPPAVRLVQAIADWWSDLTRPVLKVFEAGGVTMDPEGPPTTATATEDPTGGTEHRGTIDPDG